MSVAIMIDGSVKRNRKFGIILQSLHVIKKCYKKCIHTSFKFLFHASLLFSHM